jgi:hypothetical protein
MTSTLRCLSTTNGRARGLLPHRGMRQMEPRCIGLTKITAMTDQTTADLTPGQIKALRYLASLPPDRSAAPNEIGQAMGGTKSGKAQGLGRMGGAMAHRLIKMHLVVDMSPRRGGFPAYAITHEGRKHPALKEVTHAD